jgi:glycosyltransferase involved in cell wall biosynthesis
MPPISVIIPTFNRRESLTRALRSALAQTGAAYDIWVIDDGSTDGTGDMLRQEFPSVQYAWFPNAGPAAARNRGIERSQGEWIAFLDSDDEWRPGKLQAQLEFFRAHPEYRIAQTEEIWIRNGRRVNPMKKHRKFGGQIFEKCLPLCLISPSAVMLQRSLLEETGLFDESFPACEDYDLWLRIACRHPVGLLQEPYVIKYGGHADQRSAEFPAMDQFRIRALQKILESGRLDSQQRQTALAELEIKSRIYMQGALKRGKHEEAEKVQGVLNSFKFVKSET